MHWMSDLYLSQTSLSTCGNIFSHHCSRSKVGYARLCLMVPHLQYWNSYKMGYKAVHSTSFLFHMYPRKLSLHSLLYLPYKETTFSKLIVYRVCRNLDNRFPKMIIANVDFDEIGTAFRTGYRLSTPVHIGIRGL